MIHCRNAAQVSQHRVTHVSAADLEMGAGGKCNLGQFIMNIWKGSRSCFADRWSAAVGRPAKAKGIQLCFN